MDLKLIIIAIVSLIITIKVFSGAKVLPAVVGFMGVCALLLIATNEIIHRFF